MGGVRQEVGVLEVPNDRVIWAPCNPPDRDDGAVDGGTGDRELGDLPLVVTFGGVGFHQRGEVILFL